MQDRASQLERLSNLYQTGVLTEAEFHSEKQKVLNAPVPLSQSPGFHIGQGPVPRHRRSPWLWWGSYIIVVIIGTMISTSLYNSAYENCQEEEYYDDYWGYGYIYCEPDADLLAMSTIIDLMTTITYLVIYISWTYNMYSEFNKYMGHEIYSPFLAACIPIFNIYAFYIYCDHLKQQGEARGSRNIIEPGITCCLLFILGIGLPMYQSSLNQFWDIVERQKRHSPPPPPQTHNQAAPIEWN